MFGADVAGTVPAGTTGFAAPAANLLDVPDVDDSVVLFELRPAGAAGEPEYVPMTAGTFTAGTLPYPMPSPPEVPLFFSDVDWTNRQNNPPVLDFDLTRLPLDPRIVFMRASAAWHFDSSGNLRQASAHTPRIDYHPWSGHVLGLLCEPASTNALRTPDNTGSIVGDVGDPFGTFPDHWDFGWFGAAVTFSVTGKGVEYGMNYCDIRIQTTATGNDQAAYIFLEADDHIAAIKNETWTFWTLARIVSGGMANITDLRIGLDEFDNAHNNLTGSLDTVLAALLSNAPRQIMATRTLTENATARIRPFFSVHYDNGAVVDITVRFYHAQVEKMPFATSTIPVGGGTRAAETLAMPVADDWFNPAAGAVVAEFSAYALNAAKTQSVFSFDDGTLNESLYLRAVGAGLAVKATHGGAAQADITIAAFLAAQVIYRAALRYGINDYAAKLNSSDVIVDTSGAIPTVTHLRLGCRAAGVDQLSGHLRRLSYWPGTLSDQRLTESVVLGAWPPAFAAPNDATANQHYEGRALLPQIEQSLPLPPEGNHRAGLTIGELVIDNTDGVYDTLARTVGIDGRAVAIKRLPRRGARYAEAVPIFTGVGQDWVASGNQLRIALRDNSRLLEVPFQALYGGAGGADGTVDSTGQPIMQCYGLCRNVASRLVDPAKLIYQLHDRIIAGVDAVRVRGAVVTAGATQASYAALNAATVSAGTYQTALTATGSYIRLGSNPDGPVTVDLRGDALGGYIADTAGIMRRLLLRVLTSDHLAPDSFSSLTTQLSGAIGLVINETMMLSGAITLVLAGTYTYLADQSDGRLAVGRLGLPYAGASLAISQENLIGEPMRVPLPDAIAPCLWRVRVGYRRNWLPMSDSDVVPYPTLTETQRQELKETERLAISADISRRSWHPAAGEAVLHSLFDSQADAQALADFLLTMFAPARELWELPLANTGHGIALNDNINVSWSRGGLADGKSLRVVGRTVSGNKVALLGFG
ncbi:MAG: hypothetical protein WBK91_04130 [Alphaproteobacteria bacterium]